MRFKLLKSDLNPASRDVRGADLRRLPYNNCSVDVLVLDPPYAQNVHSHALAKWYSRGSPAMTAADRRELYRGGMREAARVLKPGGTLWVKTKDQVEWEGQRWRHIEIYQDALALGFCGRDLFVILTAPPILGRWNKQKHARKNYSFLWIFQKETARIAGLMGFLGMRPRRDA
jgi:DNA modification methylase